MAEHIRVLFVEDSLADLELTVSELRRFDYDPEWTRVETEAQLREALIGEAWDIAIVDYRLPAFSGPAALTVLEAEKPDLPAIIVAGAIGEEAAVETMHAGAADCILKSNLDRLVPAVRRVIADTNMTDADKPAIDVRAEPCGPHCELFHGADEGIIIAEFDGTVVEANAAAYRLAGLGPGVAANLFDFGLITIADAMPEGEQIAPAIAEIKAGKRLLFETALGQGTGATVPVEVRLVPFTNRGQATILAIVRDVSRHKTMQTSLADSGERLRAMLDSTVEAMGAVVESRDRYTAGHQRRVTQLALAIAASMGLDDDRMEGIRLAGAIHDIGKIGIPNEIISKPARLNETEFGFIKMHPQTGHDVLKSIPFDQPVAEIVLQHHERINGSGYPNGLAGDEILIEARVLAAADVVEAMASHRPWRPALELQTALAEIRGGSGELYDADVVSACLSVFESLGFEYTA
jgi:HD-GYP domain-containing protein (c-di-GMP phosphodiesterase class II)/CheY-like chemotaxis protein